MKYIFLLILVTCLFRENSAGASSSTGKSRRHRHRHRHQESDQESSVQEFTRQASPPRRITLAKHGYVTAADFEEILDALVPVSESNKFRWAEYWASLSSSAQLPEAPQRLKFQPLFLRDLSRLEKYVHENIANVNKRWLENPNDTHLVKVCEGAANLKVLIFDIGNFTLFTKRTRCTTAVADRQIEYRNLVNVPHDTAKLLYCNCNVRTNNPFSNQIIEKFYVINMGFSENDEKGLFHYIHLYRELPDQGDPRGIIQFGWEITVFKNTGY